MSVVDYFPRYLETRKLFPEIMEKDVEEFTVTVSSHHQLESETNINPSGSSRINQAVLVRNATKSYGVGRNRCAVLEGLDMTVKRGSM